MNIDNQNYQVTWLMVPRKKLKVGRWGICRGKCGLWSSFPRRVTAFRSRYERLFCDSLGEVTLPARVSRRTTMNPV